MQKFKILTLVFVCISVFTIQAYAEGQKIATLDLSRTFDQYLATKEYDGALSEKTESYKKERDKKVAELDELRAKLALLKEGEKEKAEKEFNEKLDALNEYDQSNQTDLRKERDEKVREILLEIEKMVNDYAQKNKYDVILNDRVLIYGNDALDITDDVLKILNDSYNSKK